MERRTINSQDGSTSPHALTVACNNTRPTTTAFLQGATVPLTSEELERHTVPAGGEGKALISQAQFVKVVRESLHHIFSHERIATPQLCASHPVFDEDELSVLKPVNVPAEEAQPLYYEKLAFLVELPSVCNQVGGDRVTMAVGGTMTYDNCAAYTGTGQVFHLFAGFTVKGTGNCCLFRNGLLLDVRPTCLSELKQAVYALLCEYDSCYQLEQMERMHQHVLTDNQFALLLGKARLYQHLPAHHRQLYPDLLFTDMQLDSIAKGYLQSERFGREEEGMISLWRLYNLFNEANKCSHIDLFLRRGANASAFIGGLASVRERKNYHWFLH